jgi:hypothetical protein
MTRRIVGETETGGPFWHTVDEKMYDETGAHIGGGPDDHAVAEAGGPNSLSLHKTMCGLHYNSDPVDEDVARAHSFAMCPACEAVT